MRIDVFVDYSGQQAKVGGGTLGALLRIPHLPESQ
jgi:hypothetical protein